MGTGSFPGLRCGRGVKLIPHPLLVPRSNIEHSYTSTLPKGLCDLWKDETYLPLRGGADKSLARPGKKQATATKLGIYSTYSPPSSVHFLARCSNFYKPLKKIRRLSVQPGLRGSNDLRVGREMATFQLFFFSVQGTGGSPTGPDPGNKVGDQDTGSPGRPVSYGLQVSGEPGQCRARLGSGHPLGDLPAHGVFPSKCPSIAPAEMSDTPHW